MSSLRWRHRVAQLGVYCFDVGEWLVNFAYGPNRIAPDEVGQKRIIDDPFQEAPTAFACPVKIGAIAEAMRAEGAALVTPARKEERPMPLAGSLAARVAQAREQ